jgi:glycosyltransferase involved in cell wall biosynthesis
VPAGKIRLTYNGVDTEEFRPDASGAAATRRTFGLPGELPLVLFVGRMVPKKGTDHLIQATDASYQIVLVGPGNEPPARPGVSFLGPVDRSELLGLYQASQIFAFPAKGEMFTLAMQEAMSCGLPVVTTNDPAYDSYELDGRGIALVEPEPEALRAAFLDILSDVDRRFYMSAYSRNFAEEHFDWQHNAAGMADDYEVALADSGRRASLGR